MWAVRHVPCNHELSTSGLWRWQSSASYTLKPHTRFFFQRLCGRVQFQMGVGAYNAEGPVYPANRSSPSSILSSWAVWRSGQAVSIHLAFPFLFCQTFWVQPGKALSAVLAQIIEAISVKPNLKFLSKDKCCVAIREGRALVPFLGLIYRQKTLTNSFNSPWCNTIPCIHWW